MADVLPNPLNGRLLRKKYAGKTPVLKSNSGPRSIKVKQVRTVTNDQLINDALAKKKYVKLRVVPQIMGADGKPYGMNGRARTVAFATRSDFYKALDAIDKQIDSWSEQ